MVVYNFFYLLWKFIRISKEVFIIRRYLQCDFSEFWKKSESYYPAMSHFDINKQSENLILVLQNLVYNYRYIPTTGIYRYTGRSTCRGPRNSFLWLSVGAKMTKSQIAIHCSSLCSILSKMIFFYHFKHFNRNDAAVTGAVSRSFHLLSKM